MTAVLQSPTGDARSLSTGEAVEHQVGRREGPLQLGGGPVEGDLDLLTGAGELDGLGHLRAVRVSEDELDVEVPELPKEETHCAADAAAARDENALRHDSDPLSEAASIARLPSAYQGPNEHLR